MTLKFAPGKIVERFRADSDSVVLRYPKNGDERKAMAYINALIGEGTFIALSRKVSLKEEQKWLKGAIRSARDGTRIPLVIEANGKYVGTTALARKLKPPNPFDHTAEFGISIARDYRKRGIAEHAAKTLFELARKNWNLKMVISSYVSGNAASAALHRKLGFKTAGRIPKGARFKNKYFDSIIAVKQLK